MEIVSALLAIVIRGIIFGCITKYLAGTKGYEKGFAWGFWLGIVGLLVVGFRPTLQAEPVQMSTAPTFTMKENESEFRSISQTTMASQTWTCSCGAKNSKALDYCTSCRRKRGETVAVVVRKVKCPHCGANNSETNDVCFACNKSLKEDV